MAFKTSIYAITLLCSFLIYSSLQTMEIELVDVTKEERPDSQTKTHEDTIIKSLGELKKSWHKKQSVQEQQPDLDPAFMADLFSDLQHDTCETAHQSHLKKNLTALKELQPKKFKQLAKGILEYCNKYDGDLSSDNRKKIQKSKDSSSSGSQPLVTLSILDINNAEIRKLKKQMKKLTLQATEDAIKEKENETNRYKVLACATPILSAIITGCATYYSAVASHPAAPPCAPCSPTPPLALPVPPGISPV
jgi:hypothetical protein